jgi:excisionase family DNA binding protein
MMFTVREAANQLGVSPSTVYNLCQRRRLRHERHGLGRGVIRIPIDAIDEYRESVTVKRAPGGDGAAMQAAHLAPKPNLRHLSL